MGNNPGNDRATVSTTLSIPNGGSSGGIACCCDSVPCVGMAQATPAAHGHQIKRTAVPRVTIFFFLAAKALLRRTLEEVPDSGGEEKETFGVLHEALRPLAHRYRMLPEGREGRGCTLDDRLAYCRDSTVDWPRFISAGMALCTRSPLRPRLQFIYCIYIYFNDVSFCCT